MVTWVKLVSVLWVAGLLLISGCGRQGGPSPIVSQPGASTPDAIPAVAVTPEMAEILARADALDGQDDKIVSLCASCALGMDGSSEHSLHVGEYTMYFCADHCKQAFSENIAESVLGMKLPTAEENNSP